MKNIRGEHLTFAKSRLNGLSDGHLKALYVFAHILNRLRLLESQVFAHWNTSTAEPAGHVKSEAAGHGAIETLLYLAAELKEAWEAIQSCYHTSQLSKSLNSRLPAEVQEALKRIPKHCSGDGVIYKLRNQFSYHHSPDEVLAAAKELVDDDPHNAFLFEGENNFFGFAADLRILTIAKVLGISNPNKLMEYLVREVAGEAYNDISATLTAILAEILSEAGVGVADVELSDVPSSDELRAGFFFHIDNKKES